MKFTITRRRRSQKQLHGRFGGGWQWKVGAQAGTLSRARGTVEVSLLITEVRIEWER